MTTVELPEELVDYISEATEGDFPNCGEYIMTPSENVSLFNFVIDGFERGYDDSKVTVMYKYETNDEVILDKVNSIVYYQDSES